MTDEQLESYARLFHERGRMTVNAEREKPFNVRPWPERTAEEREIDLRGASAVAAQAVADAGLAHERMKAQLFALTAHRPAIFDALNIVLRLPELYESQKKRYRAALKALGGVEEDGSDA